MTADLYTLDRFVEDARAIVARQKGDLETVQALTPLLERIVSRQDCLADRGGDQDPDRGFEVYVSPTLSIQAIVWHPDRGAPPHNHNGWAMVGVIRGHERNTLFHRKDDGSRPWRVELEQAEVADILPGQTGFVIPPHDIHSVEIPSGKTLAIHLFGADIRRQWRCTFDPETGEVRPFVPRLV